MCRNKGSFRGRKEFLAQQCLHRRVLCSSAKLEDGAHLGLHPQEVTGLEEEAGDEDDEDEKVRSQTAQARFWSLCSAVNLGLLREGRSLLSPACDVLTTLPSREIFLAHFPQKRVGEDKETHFSKACGLDTVATWMLSRRNHLV